MAIAVAAQSAKTAYARCARFNLFNRLTIRFTGCAPFVSLGLDGYSK
jgi:hypothetical protein